MRDQDSSRNAWSKDSAPTSPRARRSSSARARNCGFQTKDPFLQLGDTANEPSNVAAWIARCSGNGRGPWRGGGGDGIADG